MTDDHAQSGDPGAQLFLPVEMPSNPDQPMPQVYREGRYTLEQVPEATQLAIVALRGVGYSIQEVARTLHCHNKTVMAVDRYRSDEIATRKERTAAMALDTADLAIGAVRERLANGETSGEKVKDLALTAAILADKGLVMAGEATHRVRVEFQMPGHAEFQAELQRMGLGGDAAGQKAEPVDVDVVEIGPAEAAGDQGDGGADEGASDE